MKLYFRNRIIEKKKELFPLFNSLVMKYLKDVNVTYIDLKG